MTRTVRWSLAVLLALVAPAVAGDVCLKTGNDRLVIRKLKKLKPGRPVPVTGLYLTQAVPTQASPVAGTALVMATGVVKIGMFVHGLDYLNDFSAVLVLDSTFTGTMHYDNTGVFDEVGTLGVTPITCEGIVFP